MDRKDQKGTTARRRGEGDVLLDGFYDLTKAGVLWIFGHSNLEASSASAEPCVFRMQELHVSDIAFLRSISDRPYYRLISRQ